MDTDALTQCRAGIYPYMEALILCGLGKVALARGELNAAQTQFEQAYKINDKDLYQNFHMEPHDSAMCILEATAALAAAQGSMEGATCLLGATEAEYKKVFYGRLPRERQELEACIGALRAAMDEQAFATAWAEGEAMTLEQAVIRRSSDRAVFTCLHHCPPIRITRI